MNRDDLVDELLDRKRVMVTDWARFRTEQVPRMTRVYVGRMAYTDVSDPMHPVRYVDAADWPYSPHELAGIYLRRVVQLSGARQAWATRGELRHLACPHPLHWVGTKVEGDLAYVDLRRAYWSLYTRLGRLDRPIVVRHDEVVVGDGMIPLVDAGMWRDTSLGRNAVVGITRATRFTELHRGQPVSREGPSRVTSPRLWRLLALILHSVALDLVERFGAVCVHTDGYILPAHYVRPAMAHLRATWGLDSRVKGRGEGVVTGIGSYSIGDYRSVALRAPLPALSNLLEVSRGQRASLARLLVDG